MAIIISHAIQYYAPLHQRLARHDDLEIKVFFTWHSGNAAVRDRGFQKSVAWDIPLTEGYQSELVPNVAPDPGTHHFLGLRNPALVERVLAWKPDVVHLTGWAWHSHLIALRAFAKRGVPVFFRGDSHLLDSPNGPRWWIKQRVLREVFKWPSAFLAVGAANRAYYETFGVDADRIFACPHSIDVRRFAEPAGEFERRATEWREQLGIAKDQVVLLFAGKLERKKRPLELMRAVQALNRPGCVLVMVGNGELEREVRALAAADPGRFRILPFHNQSRMPVIYRLGDLFVLPSSHEETWGLGVNEAMACGRPVLVSDRVGCASDVVTPSCGRVFPSGDNEGLVRALADMTMDIEKLREMGRAAARRAWAFDIGITEASLIDALNSFLRHERRSRVLLATEVWKSHGGVQRYMRMIARILADRGEPFAVLSLLDDDDHRPAAAAAYSVACGGSKWRFCVDAFRLALRGMGRGIIVGHVGLLPVAWILRRMNLTEGYTVVLHGIEAWRRHSWMTRIAARRASRVVATTLYTAREFCSLNDLDIARCCVIPLAADDCDPIGRPDEPRGELKLLLVSRMTTADRYKGIDTLLHSVRLGLDSGLALSVDLVGDGNDKVRLENVARILNICDVVRFRGAMPDEEVRRLYHEAHVFVMPSKKEGFGIVFLEAMAAGLPCIGANHGGTPEVIDHGETGFLIEYGDAEQLVIYLRAIAESPELYYSLSRAARRRATDILSFHAMYESWRGLIDALGPPGTIVTDASDSSGAVVAATAPGSAQAAGRGVIRTGNLGEVTAPGESVVRELHQGY